MSLDYTGGQVAREGAVLHGVIVNGTYVIPMRTITSVFSFHVIGVLVKIVAAAAGSTHLVKLQKSASGGSFASPVELCSLPILSSYAAASSYFGRVTDSLAKIDTNYLVRLVHVAEATDASLDYDYEVFTNQRDC